jgi:uncharacterized DUF497 family protein
VESYRNDRFEWDLAKASANVTRHNVTFEDAATVFNDPFLMTVPDLAHSDDEERFFAIGYSESSRLLLVVHSEIRDTIRIISARLATRRERNSYEQGPI